MAPRGFIDCTSISPSQQKQHSASSMSPSTSIGHRDRPNNNSNSNSNINNRGDDNDTNVDDWSSYCDDDDQDDDLEEHPHHQSNQSKSLQRAPSSSASKTGKMTISNIDDYSDDDEDSSVEEEDVKFGNGNNDVMGKGQRHPKHRAEHAAAVPAPVLKTPPSTPMSSNKSSTSTSNKKKGNNVTTSPSESPAHRQSNNKKPPARTLSNSSKSPPPPPAGSGAVIYANRSSPSRNASSSPRVGINNSNIKTTPQGNNTDNTSKERSLSITMSSSSMSSGHSSVTARLSSRRRKKIQWKKSVRVHVIPNLMTFSEQEKRDSWYQGEEYTLMEDECDLTSEVMDSKRPVVWPDFCGRGLESWTMEGEQRKERHVQLAIDLVWQAQLNQWRQASNTDECWEYIRSQYVKVSKHSLVLAAKLARQDEVDVQSYLSSVRAVERSRRKMIGFRGSRVSGGALSSSSHHSTRRTNPPDGKSPSDHRLPSIVRPILKGPDVFNSNNTDAFDNDNNKASSRTGSGPNKVRNNKTTSTPTEGDEDVNTAISSLSGSSSHGNAKKKIEFKSGSKSKTKIPTSPVGSLCSSYAGTEDTSSTLRRMRSSHMSVASDESSRRRMLRAPGMKTPL